MDEKLLGFCKNATVVFVHGAWVDGSSWGTVINRVAEAGLAVICAPLPLTTLSDARGGNRGSHEKKMLTPGPEPKYYAFRVDLFRMRCRERQLPSRASSDRSRRP